MDFLDENESIGNLVAKVPEYASIFEKLKLNYCCKGNKTLKQYCNEKNLDVAEVSQKLKQALATEPVVDLSQKSLQEIIEHIIDTYHANLREELPRISQLLKKLNSKHGNRYPYVSELQIVFEKMKDSLLEHMSQEEKVVFPIIAQLDVRKEEINNYLSSLEQDHLEIGAALQNIRKLTNGYTAPLDACMTHIVILNDLKRLEQNLYEHIHKENHVLFPRSQNLC